MNGICNIEIFLHHLLLQITIDWYQSAYRGKMNWPNRKELQMQRYGATGKACSSIPLHKHRPPSCRIRPCPTPTNPLTSFCTSSGLFPIHVLRKLQQYSNPILWKTTTLFSNHQKEMITKERNNSIFFYVTNEKNACPCHWRWLFFYSARAWDDGWYWTA